MSVLVNGTSVITAGLDHWYDTPDDSTLALEEYDAYDWRLEARLHVTGFRLPPDYRPSGAGPDRRNVKLTVPVLRFPLWNFCMYCKRLKQSTLTMQQHVDCPDAKHEGQRYRPHMSQVPFVTICSAGHIDDFPFREWVHRSLSPRCDGTLRLVSRGGGGLEGQVIKCDACRVERSLLGITTARTGRGGEEHTTLTDQLAPEDGPYNCTGARPWLGEPTGACTKPTRGALRAAGNVYFPKVESSIYLPKREGAVSAEMHELIRRPDVRPLMKLVNTVHGAEVTAQMLRESLPVEVFQPFEDDEILAGFYDLVGESSSDPGLASDADDQLSTASEWRFPEYERIRDTPRDTFLKARDPGIPGSLTIYLDRVRQVDVLRETRALRGFTRVRDSALTLADGKALLRRKLLAPAHDWLPAYVVKGEGIYLELNNARLLAWETQAEVQRRARKIQDFYDAAVAARGFLAREISPRFVLLHTLGHLLINELVYTCGYSSASLRERLYVSSKPGREMAGLLVYTAAGDSEGTMGGLVRMAHPDRLGAVFADALDHGQWCSTDPVCMDAGDYGQGPDSCNLAACHGCALVPETSCEEFNRFLDRGLVVGTLNDRTLGFFS